MSNRQLRRTWRLVGGGCNEVYTDFHVDSGDHVIDRAYEPAFGEFPDPDSGTTSIQYHHGDQIGTTRVMTCDTNLNNCTAGGNGEPPITRRRVYTAFGEEISTSGSVDSRYRYAGAWGYQSHDDFAFVHVGARWYDPESGRFLQRDPIGIAGGLNTYEYARSSPTVGVDPDGEIVWFLIAVAVVIVLDSAAQYANAPSPTDTPIQGSPGASPVSLYASLCLPFPDIRWLPNAKGIEWTISPHFRIGWHRFPLNGRNVYRPHFHRRIVGPDGKTLPGGGIGRHRPWE